MIYNNLLFTYSQIAGSTDNLNQDYYNILLFIQNISPILIG